jgi:PIN domain nuclease of toxin-antitoxin system
MKYLLDTHMLLWAAGSPEKLGKRYLELIDNRENILLFSSASIWEIAMKSNLDRDDFSIDPYNFRAELFNHDYDELAITGTHALHTLALPAIHKDPFDRILISQAICEEIMFLTSDSTVAQYPGPIELIT